MGIESFLQALGFGELALNPAFMAQVGVLGATVLTFVASLAIAIVAFRSAAVAHYAKADAEEHLRTARSLAAEVRSLTAQVEKSASRALAIPAAETHASHAAHDDHHDDHHASHAGHDDHHDDHHAQHAAHDAHGDGHKASHDDHHDDHHADHAADVHHISPVIAARNKMQRHAHSHDGAHSHAETEARDKSLDAATKAATVPFALLRRRSK